MIGLGDARALSTDGVRWEIQVRCAPPELPWGTPSPGEPVLRFLRFGVWTKETGLRRVPLSPVLELDLLLETCAALTEVLPACLADLPFPHADRYELWLLDQAGLPFALLASSTRIRDIDGYRPEPWAAALGPDHSFQSPRLLERGVPVRLGQDPRHHASLLEQLVRSTSRRPVRLAWFERDDAGAGSAVEPAKAMGERDGRQLTGEAFPPLLLREEWPEPADRELVRDYLDWCAPFLLLLPGLSDAMRDRLEHAARARAMEVDALYGLYPKILNPDLFRTLRVEARVRRART